MQAVDSKSSIFYRNISYAFHALPMLLLLLRNFITISTTYLLVAKYLPLLQPSHSSERDKLNFHWDNCPYASHRGPLALGNSGLNPPSLLATIGGYPFALLGQGQFDEPFKSIRFALSWSPLPVPSRQGLRPTAQCAFRGSLM